MGLKREKRGVKNWQSILQSDDGEDNDDGSKSEDVGNAKGKAEDHGENAEPARRG